ncbi:MAG: hypothetical protein AB3N11_08965 [Arenibacterium sp.]
MQHEESLHQARRSVKAALDCLTAEIRAYPTPVSGCDAQYNYLIGQRNSASEALRILQEPRFVATPRTSEPNAGVESR